LHTSFTTRRLAALAVSVAVAAGLSGCGSDDGGREPTGAVSFVVGARSNMPAPQPDGQARAVLDSAIENQSYASVVVADGEPFLLDGDGPLHITGANDVAREQSKEANRQAVLAAIDSAEAETPETDLLTALSLARRSISGESGAHTIVVVDSGLSTKAPLDFTQPGLLEAEPQEVADSLAVAGALPDLSGATVVAQGLGDTAPPQ
jgi:hypothetical protein